VVIFFDELEAAELQVRAAGGVITKERFSFPGGSRFHFRDIPVEMSSHAGTPSSVSAWSTSSKATRMEKPADDDGGLSGCAWSCG
jgi:hypothetical protein